MRASVVDALTALGFTRNEALAYVALLEHPTDEGATGYELAARSGIPRSAVYTVLQRLEQSGAAFRTGGEPARYIPTSPERLLRQLGEDAAGRLGRLEEELARLPARERPEPIWILSRYGEVMARAEAAIRGARSSVHASIWPREIEPLRAALEAASARGVGGVIHCPDPMERPLPGFRCWAQSSFEPTGRSTWSHRILLVIDRDRALVGGAEPELDNQAVWTANPSLVDVAMHHIVLDITLLARSQGRDCSSDVAPMMNNFLKKSGTSK